MIVKLRVNSALRHVSMSIGGFVTNRVLEAVGLGSPLATSALFQLLNSFLPLKSAISFHCFINNSQTSLFA